MRFYLTTLVLLCALQGLAYGAVVPAAKCPLAAELTKNIAATLEGSDCPQKTDPKLVALLDKVKNEKIQQDVTINMLKAMAEVEKKATLMLEAQMQKLEVAMRILEGEIKRKKAELKIVDKQPKKQGDVSKADFPDCGGMKIMDPSVKNGQYEIKIKGNTKKIPVKCDMETMKGGWTVILERDVTKTKVVDFDKDLAAYKKGFDSPMDGNYFLGLDDMTKLTSQGQYHLMVEMEDFDDTKAWALYKKFSVGNEASNFKLTVDDYDDTSTAGDALFYHNGKPFSVKGKDNDGNKVLDWAVVATGGWWYHENGYATHPTGKHLDKTKKADYMVQTINWIPWRGYNKLKKMVFKVRRDNFKLVY